MLPHLPSKDLVSFCMLMAPILSGTGAALSRAFAGSLAFRLFAPERMPVQCGGGRTTDRGPLGIPSNVVTPTWIRWGGLLNRRRIDPLRAGGGTLLFRPSCFRMAGVGRLPGDRRASSLTPLMMPVRVSTLVRYCSCIVVLVSYQPSAVTRRYTPPDSMPTPSCSNSCRNVRARATT